MIEILNQEYLTNIFIGAMSILVAIIIFIAESIRDRSNVLEKKVIQEKTRIRFCIVYTLFVLVYMIVFNWLKYDSDECVCKSERIMYLVSHILLLFFIWTYIIDIGVVFFRAYRLNMERDYFNKELEKMVHKKVKKLEMNANKKCIREGKKLKKEKIKFKEYIKNQKIYKQYGSGDIDKSKYIPIYPTQNGILRDFDYEKLDKLAEIYENEIINEPERTVLTDPVAYIDNLIGKKIATNEPIFYCIKEYVETFKLIVNSICYYNSRQYIDDEIKIINDGLFNLANENNDVNSFDKNGMLLNYFEYLYKNDLKRS